MVATFRKDGFPNPTKDKDGELAWLLTRKYRAYKNDDPREHHEKAIPACILSLIALNQSTDIKQALSQLTIGAFFFACRSCEYLKVSKPQDKRTKLLTIGNLAFFKEGKELDKINQQPLLETADSISITFIRQKNDRKNDTITQWKTGDEILCPVRQ